MNVRAFVWWFILACNGALVSAAAGNPPWLGATFGAMIGALISVSFTRRRDVEKADRARRLEAYRCALIPVVYNEYVGRAKPYSEVAVRVENAALAMLNAESE